MSLNFLCLMSESESFRVLFSCFACGYSRKRWSHSQMYRSLYLVLPWCQCVTNLSVDARAFFPSIAAHRILFVCGNVFGSVCLHATFHLTTCASCAFFWECTRNMWAGMHVRPGVWTLLIHVCIVVSLYAFFWRDLYTSINVRKQNKHTFAHTHKHVCICSIFFIFEYNTVIFENVCNIILERMFNPFCGCPMICVDAKAWRC